MGRIIPTESIFCYDIESDSANTQTAKIKFFGYYSYPLQKTEIIHVKTQEDIDRIRNLFDMHEVLVGYNNKQYDNLILERCFGIDFRFRTIVDLWEVLAPRKTKGQWESKTYGKGRQAI